MSWRDEKRGEKERWMWRWRRGEEGREGERRGGQMGEEKARGGDSREWVLRVEQV